MEHEMTLTKGNGRLTKERKHRWFLDDRRETKALEKRDCFSASKYALFVIKECGVIFHRCVSFRKEVGIGLYVFTNCLRR
jgi:hypothetical protein